MKIIQPKQIALETGLLATNVSDSTYPEYDEDVTYTTGQRVVVYSNVFREYEALTTVTGTYPPLGSSSGTLQWLDLGPTNRYGMFDGQAGTETRRADVIDVTITPPSPVDSVAFFGLVADQIVLEVIGPAPGNDILATRTVDLTLASLNPLEGPQRIGDTAVFGLPAVAGMKIRAVITIAEGDAVCGLMLPGVAKALGTTQVGSSVGIIDFSRKEVDAFGRPMIVKRRFSKRGSFRLVMPNEIVDAVHKTLSNYRAEPVAWVGVQGLQSTVIYGWYRDFDLVISGPTVSTCTLSVEGLF